MPATLPSIDLAAWRLRLDEPITSALLLSLSLHLALLAVVQPASGGGGTGPLVIQARLQGETAEALPALPDVPPEMEPVPSAPIESAPQTATPPASTPETLLTSSVPSPAPPLPLPPVEAHPDSSTPPAPPLPAVPAIAVATGQTGAPVASPQTTGDGASLGVGLDTTWYLARQVDTHARAVDSVVPDYPHEARRRNLEGTLKLMVKIDDLGRVRDVEVVEADLPGVFDEAAMEAFRQARFHPAMKDGRPVRYQAYIRVIFKLND